MPHTLLAQVGAVVLILICGFALICGGQRERLGALIFTVGWIVSLILSHMTSFYGWLMANDIAVLIGFIALCWKAPNSWPLWACAAQGLTVMSYEGWINHLQPWVFLTVEVACGYGVLLALLIGTIAAMRAKRAAKVVNEK